MQDDTPNDSSPPADSAMKSEAEERSEARRLSPWQVAASTVASAFGVQSRRNRERDFSHGKPLHFIIAGVVFTALFVLAVVLVVNLVLSRAG